MAPGETLPGADPPGEEEEGLPKVFVLFTLPDQAMLLRFRDKLSEQEYLVASKLRVRAKEALEFPPA